MGINCNQNQRYLSTSFGFQALIPHASRETGERMGDSEAQARDLLAKAEKKLKGLSLFGNKYEDAADLLSQAANYFKLAKACEQRNR